MFYSEYMYKSCTVNSLKADTTVRQTPLKGRHIWLVPTESFLLFFCNETLYKANTSLRCTAELVLRVSA